MACDAFGRLDCTICASIPYAMAYTNRWLWGCECLIPNLTHTKVLSIQLNGTEFPPEATTWNALLLEAARIARKEIQSDEELRSLIAVNFVFGKKENDGYRYLKDADLSVQGQDSNKAWKGTFQIARKLGLTFEVIFAWREKEDSENPGIRGRFRRSKLQTIV